MEGVCVDHHHHHHRLPPRKLIHPEDDDPSDDPYSSDEFRVYEFKVRKCTRSRSHDWTDCPFAHPGEKARRRDPRRFHYSSTVCPEYRRSGCCTRGDNCEFSHGVFECWLHPSRYRTEACKDGKNCKRKICFFAHSSRELRVLPPVDELDERETTLCGSGHSKPDRHSHSQHCCRYCCALSPTSTLIGMSHFSPPKSPSLSPPVSPMKTMGLRGLSPVSRFSDRVSACGSGDTLGFNPKGLSYEDMLIAELLEGMSINEAIAGLKSGKRPGGLRVDVGNYDNSPKVTYTNHDQMQFTLSPSTSINTRNSNLVEEIKANESGLSGPDLGWVNDLLM